MALGEGLRMYENEKIENCYREENRCWEHELDLLFESNDDFASETFKVEECFEPNEVLVPTLEQTILDFAHCIIYIESEDENDLISICNEMISSLAPKEEHFIENDIISFEIQSSCDDDSSHEFEFLPFPFSLSIITPSQVLYDSVSNFNILNLFTDEDYLLESPSMIASLPSFAPPPIAISKSLGGYLAFLGPHMFLSPVQSKPPIVRPKILISDGSYLMPYTCLPLFKHNSYFLEGMLVCESTPVILQSQIVFTVDP